MARHLYHFICLLLGLLLCRCAQMVPLNGGERDTSPPKLLQAIPANGNTGFSAPEITLRFDEYVQLKDLNNQLMVSPRLKTPPEVSAEGKNVMIRFKKEELLPNTTYRLDFGMAIADMNESNSLPDFSYVFSTGTFIDTLRLSGAVTTASNNQPFAGAVVALYKFDSNARNSDSLVMITPPDYSTRTNEGGGYRLQNLPAGVYRLFAFHDNNRNNIYDGESEKVAFRNENLTLSKDTGVTLLLFNEEARKLFVKRAFSPFYGLAQVVLNKRAYSTMLPHDKSEGQYLFETQKGKEKDTISIFYHTITDTLSLSFDHPEYRQTDTVNILLPEKRINRKRLRTMVPNTGTGTLTIEKQLEITFPVWMDTTSQKVERLHILSNDDSLAGDKPLSLRWLDVRTLQVNVPWLEGAVYKVKADTGFVYDLSGVSNDTIPLTFRRQAGSDLSKLTLKLVLNRKQPYVVQLINQQGQVVQQRSFALALASSNAVSLDFAALPPGIYRAKIIFDDNANGKWDTGILLKRMQPERVIMHTKELKLLADWEVEEEVQIKE